MSTPKWMVEAIATELEGTKHHGWTCTWEHPGQFQFSHPDHAHLVIVGIDFEVPGEIQIEACEDCETIVACVVAYQAPLHTDAFVDVVRQFLLTDPAAWDGSDDPDACDPTSLETVR